MYTTFQTRLRLVLLVGFGCIGLAGMFLAVGWIIPEFICDGLAIASGLNAAWLTVRMQQACPNPGERRR